MYKKLIGVLILLLVVVMVVYIFNHIQPSTQNNEEDDQVINTQNNAIIPEYLEQIPQGYTSEANEPGTLERLDYETYEAFTYEQQSQVLNKTAYVYLPYDYDETKQYNVFYYMHGGWSNETTWLGTPERPHDFKRILDHAIEDGKIEPLIVVCPTYNNTSEEDSASYSLALQLTNLYHQELVNDLIPAVEGKYSTYASDTSHEAIVASRDHRGFGGFSMGSVTTWRTFEHCLDEFRYFLPSSGNVGDGSIQDNVVTNSKWNWNDFFIFTASGTQDFAYQSFKNQVMNMMQLPSGNFKEADNEKEGNIAFREQEGAVHNGDAANQYAYNGLRFFWNNNHNEEVGSLFTLQSTIKEVVEDPSFEDFGRLLFPLDRSISEDMTLAEVSSSDVYVWYSNIQPDKSVEVINTLKQQADNGEQVFYNIYSEEEIANDPTRANTGLFYFKGTPGQPYAIMNAGGGFMYVGAMHDSFPHALEVSKEGYNAFALIYRVDNPYEDLAKAITFIHDHSEELELDASQYSLWGGSAGARMAAILGNSDYLLELTQRNDIPQASSVIMQYTGYQSVSSNDAPTYACVGTNDGIASYRTMQNRLQSLSALGIPTEFHVYDGLRHGFGLGTNTEAQGWIYDAINFWESNMVNG